MPPPSLSPYPPPRLPPYDPPPPPPALSAEVVVELGKSLDAQAKQAVNLTAAAERIAVAINLPASRVIAAFAAAPSEAGRSVLLVHILPANSTADAPVVAAHAPSAQLKAQNLTAVLVDTGEAGQQLRADLQASLSAPIAQAVTGLVAASSCHEASYLYATGVAVAQEQCVLDKAALAITHANELVAAETEGGNCAGAQCEEGLTRDTSYVGYPDPCQRCVADAGCVALGYDNTTTRCVGPDSQACIDSQGTPGLTQECEGGFQPAGPYDRHLGLTCALEEVGVLSLGCHFDPASWIASNGEVGHAELCKASVETTGLDVGAIAATPFECNVTACDVTAGALGFSCADITCRVVPGTPEALIDTTIADTFVGLSGVVELSCGLALPDGDCRMQIAAPGSDPVALPAFCNTSRCAPIDEETLEQGRLAARRASLQRECDAARVERGDSGLVLAAVGTALLLLAAATLLAVCCASTQGRHFEAEEEAGQTATEVAPKETRQASRGELRRSATSQLSDEWVDSAELSSASEAQAVAARRLAKLIAELAPLERAARLTYEDLCVTHNRPCWGVRGGGGGYVVEPLSGVLLPGGLSALMGPSGSGKTTLLNALAGVSVDGVTAHGHVMLDGKPLPSLPLGTVGYAAQEDLLLSTYTPYEALVFAAHLGLPRSSTAAQRTTLVEAALRALGLSRVAGRTVGLRDAGSGGLSGGERKRVSLGVALVTAPAILLCDEPTSGLDAFAAHALATVLAAVAQHGNRTVLLSVHQPSSQVYNMVDHLTLLADGRTLYRGAASAVDAYIRATGGSLPPTPAGTSTPDHLLYLCCSHRGQMQAAHKAAMALPDSDEARGRDARGNVAGAVSGRRTTPGVLCQARVLAYRACLHIARHPTLLRVQLLTFVLMAVLLGIIFQDVADTAAGFQNKAGSLNFMLYLFGFGGLSMLASVAQDWALFWREFHAGLYPAAVHVTVKLSLDLLLLRVLPALVFGAIAYSMMGLRREASSFLLFELSVALANLNAGLLCSAIGLALHRNPGAATLLAAVLMLLTLLPAGLQANIDSLPELVRGMPYCSWAYYAYDLMLSEELRGELVLVEVPGGPSVYLDADILLDLLGLGKLGIAQGLLALAGLALFWLLVNCAIVLLLLRPRRGGSAPPRGGALRDNQVGVAMVNVSSAGERAAGKV